MPQITGVSGSSNPHETHRRERRKAARPRYPDPRYSPCFVDANFFDRNMSPDEASAAELLLQQAERLEIMLSIPHSVRTELDRPETPAATRANAARLIYSINTGRGDFARLRMVQAIMRGNALSDKHDADAAHLYDAALWQARYFITHDRRIHRKQAELQQLRETADLWIVYPSELLRILQSCTKNDLPH